MDATTTYAQATADFTAEELALFGKIDDAEQAERTTHACAVMGSDFATRSRNEANLPRERAKLNALLDSITMDQGHRYGAYRRVMREWRATA